MGPKFIWDSRVAEKLQIQEAISQGEKNEPATFVLDNPSLCLSGVFVRILLRGLPQPEDGTRAYRNLQTVLAQMDPWNARE